MESRFQKILLSDWSRVFLFIFVPSLYSTLFWPRSSTDLHHVVVRLKTATCDVVLIVELRKRLKPRMPLNIIVSLQMIQSCNFPTWTVVCYVTLLASVYVTFTCQDSCLEGGRSQQSVNMKADVWTRFRFNGRHIEMHRESWIVIESWVQGRFRLYATRSLNLEGRVCLKRQTNKKNWNIKFKKTKNKLFEDIERLQNHLFNVRFLFFQVELSLFVHFVPYV